jgi:hypothetical protein
MSGVLEGPAAAHIFVAGNSRGDGPRRGVYDASLLRYADQSASSPG